MKAKSATLMLLWYKPGEHEEVTRWHEEVHRPEMHGGIPDIYHSEDWVAPLDYMQARPPSEIPKQGGEYLCIYLSQGTAEDLYEGVQKYSAAGRAANKYHPYQEILWRERLAIYAGHKREGLELDLDAVPLRHNTGILCTITEVPDASKRPAYEQWLNEVQIPRMLGTGIFSGHLGSHPMGEAGLGTYVEFFYVESGDALEQYKRLQEIQQGWDGDGGGRKIFDGMYRRIIPGKYDAFYV